MKCIKIIILFSVAVIGLSLTSCEQEAISESEVKSETLKQSAKAMQEDVLFASVDEFLDYFDALYREGDVYSLIQYPEGIDIEQETEYTTTAKHDYETKNRIKFARWCDEQLEAGKTLTIGKKADGTYWADIKK